MIKHVEKRYLNYSSDQMFELVADIESYPAFIPWCSKVTTISRSKDNEQRDILEADMCVSFKVFSETFSSRVSLDAISQVIVVEYLNGPFKYLNNKWNFTKSSGGCIVDFNLEFEFKSRMMQRIIGVVFQEAMRKIVLSFERRADNLYR